MVVVVLVVMCTDAVNAIKLAIYIAVSDVRLPTMQATHVSLLSSSNIVVVAVVVALLQM